MKFDLDKPILDLDGVEVTRPKGNEQIRASMRYFIRDALISSSQPMAAAEAIRRFDLQASLAGDGLAELDAEDIVLIQQCLAQKYGPLVVGQIARELKTPAADRQTAAS